MQVGAELAERGSQRKRVCVQRCSLLLSDTRMKNASANELFQALDGRTVSVRSRAWRIEITGIFEQDGSSWVQLTLQGTPSYNVAVKIGTFDTAAEVVETLRSWLAFPTKSSSRVLCFEQ